MEAIADRKHLSKKEIRKAVEAELEKYQMYLLTLPSDRQPKITATYSITPPTRDTQFHSQTEEVAIYRVDYGREREEHLQRVQNAVNRLEQNEREVIIKKYFGEDQEFDYVIYNDLGMSESYYHRKFKPKIFDKLAVMFGIADVNGLFKN